MVDPHDEITAKHITPPEGESPESPKSVRSELFNEALSWAKLVVFAVLFALFINNFVIVNASVPTGSMEATIQVNDRIVAFRLAYLFSDPQLYDIVVCRGPDHGTLYVKRILGMPGDEVHITNGRVYLNGELAQYGFVQGVSCECERFCNFGPTIVPEGHYFMLGDNRHNSIDSRHWNNPFVEQRQILGRVIFRYFPGFGNLTNF